MMEVLTDAVPECLWTFFEELDEHPWLFSAIASMLVGLSGILPLLVIPIDETANFNDGPGAATLRVLLSFAVGGLLGDVFLHLLPEAWENDLSNTKEGEHVSMKCGLWVLFGMLVFIVVEKLFAVPEQDDDDAAQKDKDKERQKEKEKQKQKEKQKHEEKEKQREKEKQKEKEREKERERGKTERNGSAGQMEIEELHKFLEAEKKKRQRYSSVTEGGAELPACDAGDHPVALYASCLFNNNSPGEVGLCGESACNGVIANGVSGGRCVKGNRWMGRCLLREAAARADRDPAPADNKKHVAGYLNLMANSIDNFTHGLAVGGSFLVGFRVGVLTTFAILVHEIPHEVGDFAILLRSGFSRWEAAKAQMATATAGLVGAMTAVIFSGARNAIEAKTSWIVPFTAGGFLHIALVTVLPDLLREDDKWESLKHLAALVLGIAVMALMTQYFG